MGEAVSRRWVRKPCVKLRDGFCSDGGSCSPSCGAAQSIPWDVEGRDGMRDQEGATLENRL